MIGPTRPTAATALMLAALAGTPQSAPAQVNRLYLYSAADSTAPRDPNGFLFNPAWHHKDSMPNLEERCRFRTATNHLEERTLLITSNDPCLSPAESTVVTVNEPPVVGAGLLCATNSLLGNIRGHVNWFPVTATGLLKKPGYSGGAAGDKDVQIDLEVRSPNALTSGNAKREGYHTEFHVLETLTRLPDPGTSWWHDVKTALVDKKHLEAVVTGRFAIVTGLYGLDGVHQFQAELHPVFAMAVLETRNGSRETWAIMVRNLGNEGNCASGHLPMNTGPSTDSTQDYVFDLGWWQGATGAKVTMTQGWTSDTSLVPLTRTVVYGPIDQPDSGHVYIDFPHRRPQPGHPDFLFLGTIHVDWQGVTSSQMERLQPWLPSDTARPVLESATPADVSLEDLRKLGRALPSGLAGRGAFANSVEWAPLDSITRDTLPPIPGSWQPAARVRAEPTYAWLPRKPVLRHCQDPTSDPVCHSGGGWVAGGVVDFEDGYGFSRVGRLLPSISLYLPPHGSSTLTSFELAGLKLGEGLSIPGYRLDIGIKRARLNSPAPDADSTAEGVMGSLHFLFPGTSLRLASWFVITPYFTPSVSLMRTSHVNAVGNTVNRFRVRRGFGGGLLIHFAYQELFVEGNHQSGGRLRAQEVLRFGLLFR